MRFKIILILFLLISLKSFGQSADSIETDISRSYGRVMGTFFSNTLSVAQQFPYAYDSFVKKLVNYTSTDPLTITYPFTHLREHHITVLTSEDSLFRVYSWHLDFMSDQVFPCGNVWQYKWKDKIFSAFDTLGKPAAYCLQLFTVRNHGTTWYLCVYVNPVSRELKRQSIIALTIKNGQLIDHVKIFKTDKGLTDRMDVDIAVTAKINRQKWKEESVFSFKPSLLTIESPERIENDDRAIGHVVYKFTGQYFEKVKN
ncbi:MAG: hypothetical protein ACXVB0_15605 [Mucilaginibacter sp.]